MSGNSNRVDAKPAGRQSRPGKINKKVNRGRYRYAMLVLDITIEVDD
ncbi:hypothetical protein [uncultured Sphingomonas sp.]